MPGGSPGETAYHAAGVVVIGDAVTNLDGLQILPEKYCADLPLLINSLRDLRALEFDIACFGAWTSDCRQGTPKVDEIV